MGIGPRGGMEVITESLHRQRSKFLWDLLFDKHSHGNFIRGKWEGMGAAKADVPSDKLMLEMFKRSNAVPVRIHRPTKQGTSIYADFEGGVSG